VKKANFSHVFANHFFVQFFQNLFKSFEISVKFCIFYFVFFKLKMCFLLLALFLNIEGKWAQNGSAFLLPCLRI
jgi:hypothetical protein